MTRAAQITAGSTAECTGVVEACDASLSSAFGLLGKRWNGLILAVLGDGASNFADLRRSIPPITDSMLSDRLSELARAGLVTRAVTDTRPPGVSYALTPAGVALRPILEDIRRWADAHLERRPVRT